MNKKYERYINFVVDDLQPPYYENMRDIYGLRPDEYELVLSKVFNEPIKIINDDTVVKKGGITLYREKVNGFWVKKEYNADNQITYREYYDGYWERWEYDVNGNKIYYENEEGDIEDNR
tara:strand:+ start:256 stop:612 length:357 start_codon:yes stop_codon:yes gene_type:complete